MPIQDIVNVQISRETVSVSRAGFSTIMILGPNANFNARLQFFSDLTSLPAVLTGGAAAPEYLAAQAALSQNPKVTQIAIGYQQGTKIITDSAGTFTAGSIKTTVNGTLVTTAWSTAKDNTMTAHAAAIEALADVLTAVYSAGSHTITITPVTTAVLAVTVDLTAITGTMTAAVSSSDTETITDALTAVQRYNDAWYGLVITSRDEADALLAAAWVESQMKFFMTASADAEIVDTSLSSDTGSLAKVLNTAGYVRTAILYHTAAATTYPEAAWLGKILPLDPGSYTAMFKTLAGVAAVSLTTTQENNAREKFCNIYHEMGGVNITRDGVVSGEEYIDVIIFIDWLDSEMTADVYQLLVSQPKVPYTDAGIAAVESIVKKRLQIGQNRGGISPLAFDPATDLQIGGFLTTVPTLASVPTADKTARTLKNVKFTAWLSGAIHAVEVNGIVTV